MAEELTAEDKAREFGWVPKEDWVEAGKSEDDWVDAQTFNIRGQFIGDLKERDQKIKDLESKVSNFGKLMVEETNRAKERGIREAEERHKKALEEGDSEAAQKAVDDIKELSQPAKTDPLADFFSQNSDILDDEEKFELFDRYDRMLALRKGGRIDNVEAHLSEVLRMVQDKTATKAPTTEATGGRTVGKKKSKPSRSDLPEYLQRTHDMFVDQGVMKSEDYIQSLIDTGEFEWR